VGLSSLAMTCVVCKVCSSTIRITHRHPIPGETSVCHATKRKHWLHISLIPQSRSLPPRTTHPPHLNRRCPLKWTSKEEIDNNQKSQTEASRGSQNPGRFEVALLNETSSNFDNGDNSTLRPQGAPLVLIFSPGLIAFA